jgi:hypothetical protein
MTSMPTIDDRMVALFRRTGRRRASYPVARSGRLAGGKARVVPQACGRAGDPCVHDGQKGTCTWVNGRLICVPEVFPGGFDF